MSYLSTGRLLGFMLLAMILAGCGQDEPTPEGDDLSNLETTGAPPTETITQETPQPTDETISIEVAGLPIGGGADVVEGTDVQCADVTWVGASIPAGVEVQVTEVGFDPEDAFVLSDLPCPIDVPACFEATHRFTSDGGRCSVAVTPTGQPTGDDPRLWLTAGVVTCRTDQQTSCQEFYESVKNAEPQSIGLVAVFPEDGQTDSPVDGETTTPAG